MSRGYKALPQGICVALLVMGKILRDEALGDVGAVPVKYSAGAVFGKDAFGFKAAGQSKGILADRDGGNGKDENKGGEQRVFGKLFVHKSHPFLMVI